MSVKQFTDSSFQRDVVEASHRHPVLVDFWAPWCGPCRAAGPRISEVADSVGDSASVGKINVDENAEVAAELSVHSIPTVLIYREGEIVDRLVGAHPAQDYLGAIRKAAGETAA